MKKSLLIFSILGVLTFTSCSTGTTQDPPITVDDDDKTEDETPVTPVEDNYLPEDVLAKLQAEEIGFHAPSVARDMYLVYSSATGEWRDEPHLVYYDDFYVSYKDGVYIKNFVEFFDEKTTHTEEDVEEGLGDRYVWYVQKGEDNHPYMTEGEVDITNEIVFDEVLCRLGTNQHLYFDDLFANPFADVSRYNFEKDSEGNLLPDEVRLTSFGKLLRSTSLDELPELFNILNGDMSVVGPRPLLVKYLPLYNEHQARRHEVRPGFTGYAQVHGRNAISWEKKFDLDVEYVDHVTFLGDWKIIFQTVKTVLKREGISSDTAVTMEEFKGNE